MKTDYEKHVAGYFDQAADAARAIALKLLPSRDAGQRQGGHAPGAIGLSRFAPAQTLRAMVIA